MVCIIQLKNAKNVLLSLNDEIMGDVLEQGNLKNVVGHKLISVYSRYSIIYLQERKGN